MLWRKTKWVEKGKHGIAGNDFKQDNEGSLFDQILIRDLN